VSYPQVEFTENVMREGMQIESVDIPVEKKIDLLDSLGRTGLKRIAVGSFVSPRYTPQMASIDDLLARFKPVPGVCYTALALNAKGEERAERHTPPLSPRDDTPGLFAHMCDTFIRRNANKSQHTEIERWPAKVEAAVDAGAETASIGLGAAFGSNFEGEFTTDERMQMLSRQFDLWQRAGIDVTEVRFADPMGWVKPWVVEEQLERILATWPSITRFELHFHDARGLALASTYEALRVLDDRHRVHFDTTAGGIGGCPYCGNGRATGMVPTEDLVNMLEEMGIPTGVDLVALIRAVWMLEEMIGRPTFGRVSKAGPHPHGDDLYGPNLPLVETYDEARHFLVGDEILEHQLRPWREPIPSRSDVAMTRER
jgi:hydroxymethylglutaryl-CoA lyase